MEKPVIGGIIVGVLGLLGMGFYLGWVLKPSVASISFKDVDLRTDFKRLEEIEKDPRFGVVMRVPSGHAEALLGYVGMIVVQKAGDAAAPFSYVGNHRPSKEQIIVQPLDEKIFEGILAQSITGKATLPRIVTGLKFEEAAEVLIANELVLGFKDASTIPWKDLTRIPLEPANSYWFVDSVVLTSTHFKKYRKLKNTTELQGPVFAANGEIYGASEGYYADRKLSLRVFDLRLLRSGEGVAADTIGKLLKKKTMTTEDGSTLVNVLRTESLPEAKEKLFGTLILPPEFKDLKNQSQSFEQRYRIEGVPALRQEKSRGCWATAAAMLVGWQSRKKVSAAEFLAEHCPAWLSRYRSNTGLLWEEKEQFLADSGLAIEPPAGYTPKGIENMLRDYGPLWFTIGTEAGYNSHAAVVVGMFAVGSDLYISYVDPHDGREHDLPYNEFYRRYEQPAQFFNEDPNNLKAFVEGKLIPVHVVHLAKGP